MYAEWIIQQRTHSPSNMQPSGPFAYQSNPYSYISIVFFNCHNQMFIKLYMREKHFLPSSLVYYVLSMYSRTMVYFVLSIKWIIKNHSRPLPSQPQRFSPVETVLLEDEPPSSSLKLRREEVSWGSCCCYFGHWEGFELQWTDSHDLLPLMGQL